MASCAVNQAELIYLRAASSKALGPLYYMWLIAAKAAIKASIISGNADMAGEVADLGLNAMALLFRKNKDKKAQEVVGLGVGLLQQAIKKGNEPMAWAVATKYAVAFEELATRGGLEGKIKQVVEIRTTLFNQAIRATRIEEAYDLLTVGIGLLVAAAQGGKTWLTSNLSQSLVECLSIAHTVNEVLALEIVNRFADKLCDSLRNDNLQDALYLFRAMQGLSANAVQVGELGVEKIFTTAWVKTLIKVTSIGHEKHTIEYVAEIDSNILSAIRNISQVAVGERCQVGLDMLIAAVVEKEPKFLEAISSSWINLLQRLINDGKAHTAYQLISERKDIFRASITNGIPDAMTIMSKAITTTLRSAIKMEKISITIARSISKSWVLSLDEASSRGGQVGVLVHERNAAFRDAIATGNTEEAGEVSQVGVELVLAAISEGKVKLARELSLAWIAALESVANGVYRGTLDSLVEFKMKTLTEELVAGNNQEAELITNVWIELMLAASSNTNQKILQTLSRCWMIALGTATQRGYQHIVDQLVESRTKAFIDAIQRRNPIEMDQLSVAGIELLNSAIRVNNTSLKNCLSKSWVQGLSLAMMIDRPGAERLVQSVKRQFSLYIMSGGAVEADGLVKTAVEILRAAEVEGNPAVVKLIKENWGPLLQ